MSDLNERIDAWLDRLYEEIPQDDGQASAFTTMPLADLLEIGERITELLGELGEPRDNESALRFVGLRFAWEWICDVRDLRQQQELTA